MNAKLWKRPLEKQITYMIRVKTEKISRRLGKIRRKCWIKGRRDSNVLSLVVVLIHINKANQLRVDRR